MVEHGGQRDSGSAIPGSAPAAAISPSRVATARLSGALRDRAEAYRHEATVDLTILDALLKLDEPEAAAKTLDNHRALLAALARDLQVAVADAAVEREAERVWETCAAEQLAPVAVAEPIGLRRRVLALTSAAAVALLLVLPAGRLLPRTTLTSVDDRGSISDAAAALQRLEAAKSWARALRADHAAASPTTREVSLRSEVVRKKVRAILAADGSGGPAAGAATSLATVTSIEQYRARTAAEPDPSEAPSVPADEPADEILPGEEIDPGLPRSVPQALDVDLDAADAIVGDDSPPGAGTNLIP